MNGKAPDDPRVKLRDDLAQFAQCEYLNCVVGVEQIREILYRRIAELEAAIAWSNVLATAETMPDLAEEQWVAEICGRDQLEAELAPVLNSQ
jgi:hypothetical protein